MVQAQTLDSKALVQILSLLLTCPLHMPVPQFPHLQTRITTAPASEVVVRIRLVIGILALGNTAWHIVNVIRMLAINPFTL